MISHTNREKMNWHEGLLSMWNNRACHRVCCALARGGRSTKNAKRVTLRTHRTGR